MQVGNKTSLLLSVACKDISIDFIKHILKVFNSLDPQVTFKSYS